MHMSQETTHQESAESIDLNNILARVFARNETRWLNFVESLLKNRADAEDVLQEAVRHVLTRGRLLPTEEQARMYLGRAIGNAAIDAYNARKRERLRQVPLEEQTLMLDGPATPHRYLEQTEESEEREHKIRILHEALSTMPPKQYEALRLTILEPERISMRDAGILNGIPYSTLRHRTMQGMKYLRRYMLRALRLLSSS